MLFENENIEFKAKLSDEIYKEVIAFANTDGGMIYIGIDDQGNVVGLENIDESYTRFPMEYGMQFSQMLPCLFVMYCRRTG